MAFETGLNPVLCAQWLAMTRFWFDNRDALAFGEGWTLQGWRERNAAETMAVMQPEQEPRPAAEAGRKERAAWFNSVLGDARDAWARGVVAASNAEQKPAEGPFEPGEPLLWRRGPFDSVAVNYRIESPSGLHWVDLPGSDDFPLGMRQSVAVEARHLSRPPKADPAPAPASEPAPEPFAFSDPVEVKVGEQWKRGRYCGRTPKLWFPSGWVLVEVDGDVIAGPMHNVRAVPPTPGTRRVTQRMQAWSFVGEVGFWIACVSSRIREKPGELFKVGPEFDHTVEIPL